MARRGPGLMLAVLGASAALLVVAVVVSRQMARPAAEGAAAEGAPQEAAAPPEPRCGALHYQALLRSDAAAYGVAAPELAVIAAPLRGGVELEGPRALRPGQGALETPHLRLAASVAKLRASSDGTQGFRADHLILSITNRGDAPLAYRVVTALPSPGACASKADLPHDAIVLGPRQTLRRSECLYRDREELLIKRVEVYEVTELGRRYLDRLAPSEGGPFDMRLARAHVRGALAPCRGVPWRDLEGDEVWRTVVDFYARHNCDEYSLPRGYRALTAPAPLPICS